MYLKFDNNRKKLYSIVDYSITKTIFDYLYNRIFENFLKR